MTSADAPVAGPGAPAAAPPTGTGPAGAIARVLARVLARVFAGLLALLAAVFPGFGVIDLAVTWDPDWPQVLEAGWGVLFTVLVAAPLVLVAAAPARAAGAGLQLALVAAALAAAAVAGGQRPLLGYALAVGLAAAVARTATGPRPRPLAVRPPLVALAVAGAAPAVAYAVTQLRRSGTRGTATDITVGVDHQAVQGALALAALALAVAAALWRTGRALAGTTTGASAAYVGLVSLAWPGASGGVGRAASVAVLVWGVLLAAVAAGLGSARRGHDGADAGEGAESG